jgi:uncharacterized membrane protein YjfL (UPF0719 family)
MKRKHRLLFILLVAALAAVLLPTGAVLAQDSVTLVEENYGLALIPLLSTLLYGIMGVLLYVLGYVAFDRLMRLDLRRELVEDQNDALGIMMAGVFIGIAIIIASAIT